MRILLADDESNVRYGLRVLLEEQTRAQIVGEAADADELMALVKAACPDLLLLSWGLPGRQGADLLDALRRACQELYVIALSGRPEARQAVLDAGADAFVSKVQPPERLLAAIAAARDREVARRDEREQGEKDRRSENER
jgi:DNA-binding NarL/FixJ family response regulator